LTGCSTIDNYYKGEDSMGLRFLKIAVVYLVAGAVLGMYMGITTNFSLSAVHAHVMLLGWASLGLAGLVYHFYPAASVTMLAKVHFWLHNVALPVFMVALACMMLGEAWATTVVAASSLVVVIGLVVFAINVLVNVKAAPQAA
jgi:hypothetical protein